MAVEWRRRPPSLGPAIQPRTQVRRTQRQPQAMWRWRAREPRTSPQAFCNFRFFSGSERTGDPVAAYIAFSTAGAATLMVGSPTPPQNPPDGMMMASTFG